MCLVGCGDEDFARDARSTLYDLVLERDRPKLPVEENDSEWLSIGDSSAIVSIVMEDDSDSRLLSFDSMKMLELDSIEFIVGLWESSVFGLLCSEMQDCETFRLAVVNGMQLTKGHVSPRNYEPK
jgi:hypothetical protein